MFNKFALLFAGLMLTVSSVGCCLTGYGYGAGYGARGCAPCNNGCPPATGYYPQTGAFYQGYDTTQTAYVGSGLTTTAMAPMSSATTFVPTTTAAAPAPILGQPIYLNAGVPVNSLPTY